MTADAVGGVWTYALELARTLVERGVRVSLAVLGPAPTDDQRREAADIVHGPLLEHAGRLEWMDEPWHDVQQAGEWLLQVERAIRPDLVHLNGYAHGRLAWEAPVVMVGHSCVSSWWNAVHGEDPPPAWNRYRRTVARGLRAADLVVAPTAAMLACLQHHYGRLSRTKVIPNGRGSSAEGTLASASKEPFVLSAGRLWDPAKNIDAVCAVARDLTWPVLVAGEWRRPDGSETDSPESGVRWLGRLTTSEMSSWMGRASIYVSPARYEPFGLCALEAALAGCALVLGDIRSLREVWGNASLYVPPDNRQALRSALRSLIADDRFRTDMAQRALTRANQLTPARMGDGYYGQYCELVTRRRRVAAVWRA
jgi:glycosyltransferase involved in cell wall biosynthesis